MQATRDPKWLSINGIGANESFSVDTYFDVDSDDMYQFQLWHRGALHVIVDSSPLYNSDQGNYTQKFLPVSLAKGTHHLILSGKTANETSLRILFGGPGCMSLDGSKFRHVK